MKTVVISGAHSNVGKTGLASRLVSILQDSVHIKIGHGTEKEGIGNIFYPEGTSFDKIASENSGPAFLIIESNRILREMVPDLAIFLTGEDMKPTGTEAKIKADIVRGEAVSRDKIDEYVDRLGIDREIMIRIAALAGALPDNDHKN